MLAGGGADPPGAGLAFASPGRSGSGNCHALGQSSFRALGSSGGWGRGRSRQPAPLSTLDNFLCIHPPPLGCCHSTALAEGSHLLYPLWKVCGGICVWWGNQPPHAHSAQDHFAGIAPSPLLSSQVGTVGACSRVPPGVCVFLSLAPPPPHQGPSLRGWACCTSSFFEVSLAKISSSSRSLREQQGEGRHGAPTLPS